MIGIYNPYCGVVMDEFIAIEATSNSDVIRKLQIAALKGLTKQGVIITRIKKV